MALSRRSSSAIIFGDAGDSENMSLRIDSTFAQSSSPVERVHVGRQAEAVKLVGRRAYQSLEHRGAPRDHVAVRKLSEAAFLRRSGKALANLVKNSAKIERLN